MSNIAIARLGDRLTDSETVSMPDSTVLMNLRGVRVGNVVVGITEVADGGYLLEAYSLTEDADGGNRDWWREDATWVTTADEAVEWAMQYLA